MFKTFIPGIHLMSPAVLIFRLRALNSEGTGERRRRWPDQGRILFDTPLRLTGSTALARSHACGVAAIGRRDVQI